MNEKELANVEKNLKFVFYYLLKWIDELGKFLRKVVSLYIFYEEMTKIEHLENAIKHGYDWVFFLDFPDFSDEYKWLEGVR